VNEQDQQIKDRPDVPEPVDPWHEPQVVAPDTTDPIPAEENWKPSEAREDLPFGTLPYTPDSAAETTRKTGMAYQAGIAFFFSVSFCLFLGWIADWLFGSRPWGLVAGIVVGSIIGFMQFFRISSRIFKKDSDVPKLSPLMRPVDDVEPDDSSRF
jgi:F0F1-type ATP synthase assembly protein I